MRTIKFNRTRTVIREETIIGFRTKSNRRNRIFLLKLILANCPPVEILGVRKISQLFRKMEIKNVEDLAYKKIVLLFKNKKLSDISCDILVK